MSGDAFTHGEAEILGAGELMQGPCVLQFYMPRLCPKLDELALWMCCLLMASAQQWDQVTDSRR
jgi:hypothetical protein